MCQPRPLHLIKMNLEWDETGQSMRLRRGIIEVDGVMPVLVSGHACLHRSQFNVLSYCVMCYRFC